MAIPRNMAQQPLNRKRTFGECNKEACQQIIGFLVTAFNSCKDKVPYLERDFTKSSMILPLQYNNDVISYVCDPLMLSFLERSGVINWNRNVRSLLPMYTEDDGNSLSHSVSLYIFGIQDKEHHLRQLTYQMMFMQKPKEGEIYNRWMEDREQVLTKLHPIHPASYDEEWKRDWSFYLAKAQQRRDSVTQKFSSLDAIHIFTLCNVIGRPIIVYADITGNDVIDGIRYEGIYLPFLRQPKTCEKSPVLVGFNKGRFVPLFSAENQELNVFQIQPSAQSQHCAPLLRRDLTEIPIRFKRKNEATQNVLRTYFDNVHIPTHSGSHEITAAILKFKAPNAQCIELLWSMLDVVSEYVKQDQQKGISQRERNIQLQQQQHQKDLMYQPNIELSNQLQKISFQPNGQAQNAPYPSQNLPYPDAKPLYANTQNPCVRQKAGLCAAKSPASTNNNQGMCDICYDAFLRVRQNMKQRNKTPSAVPQSMPVQENQQAPASPLYQQQNFVSNIPLGRYNQEAVCVKCHNGEAIKQLENICRNCFTDEIRQNKQQRPLPQQQQYQQPLSPQQQEHLLPPQQQNRQPQGNCNHCGKTYFTANDFALCEECFEKIKRQQEEAEQQKQTVGAQQPAAFNGIYPNAGMAGNNPQGGPVFQVGIRDGMSGFGSSGYYSDGIGSGYQGQDIGVDRENIGFGAPSPTYPSVPLASVGGAAVGGGNPGVNNAEQEKVRKKILCSVAGCNYPIRSFNEIECTHHYKEKKEHKQCWVCEKNPADDNVHGVCVYCMATQGNLIREAEQDQGKKEDAFNPNRNIGRGPLNTPEQPLPAEPMNIDLFSLPDLPQPTQQAPARYNAQFNPPTVYEGYGRDKPKQTYGGQEGQLRWQQQCINEKRRCRSCSNQATYNSLCKPCYDRNTVGQQPQLVGVKCGNPDKPSCKNFVLNSKQDFMCQECINEQRAGMEKVFKNEPVKKQQPPPLYGSLSKLCITRNCVNKTTPGSGLDLCATCKQGHYPNQDYGDQPGHPRPQESQERMVECKAFDCKFAASPEYGGYCHSCFMMVSKHQAEKDQVAQQNSTGNAQRQQHAYNTPQQQQGNNYPPQPCRNPDCHMFGRPEQNGLCSKCFKLNKTERD